MKREIAVFTKKKTVGQTAFEADRENAVRNAMRLIIPTWEELPGCIKENWEVMAKRIAVAIVKEHPEMLNEFSRHVIDLG